MDTVGFTTLVAVLLVIAGGLIHFKPASEEGFASRAAGPLPECVSRSTAAQSLLARISTCDKPEAAELRLLVSKVCCMEMDIVAPSAGVYRTLNLQFRTSQDMEPPATIVGRCLRNAVNKRDIELIVEKYKARGHELIKRLDQDKEAHAELDAVVGLLERGMTAVCTKEQPHMDRPVGARDMGFWEPENVADLSQYQGVSAVPK
jgi:hypothetical protein